MEKTPQKNKVLLGITGCIAAYKSCSLVNILKKEGFEVKVVMTESATKFVAPLTFQTLSNSPIYIDMFENIDKTKVEHIHLADWCDVFVIAPATANTISKIALGLADNLLTTITMALPRKTPVVIAPAMNVHMWENPIFQKNLSELKKQGDKYVFIEPQEGKLACGYDGKGKIAEITEIVDTVKNILK
jgi:phosphopantothenoylcysteine decarboxylase/phosphopantothenate--cysteine ligase